MTDNTPAPEPVATADEAKVIPITDAGEKEKPATRGRPKKATAPPEPSIGRIVIYVTQLQTPRGPKAMLRPAIISRVDDENEGVQLTVFNSSDAGSTHVPFAAHAAAEDAIPGTYHWPQV